jgi:hypothetical protein
MLQLLASTNCTRMGPSGNITTLVFANPEGYSFELATLSDARGLAVLGAPIIDYTWFEGACVSLCVYVCMRVHMHLHACMYVA